MTGRTFELMRVWAALTGIALVLFDFLAVYTGHKAPDVVPMLVAAIGGFELMLFGQDMWYKRGANRG